MSPFSIRCFAQGSPVPANAVFILSKGTNTGRPAWEPCPNCFVLTCTDATDVNRYYWLLTALWKANAFRYHLVGSVVLFIHIRDLKKVIATAVASTPDVEKITAFLQETARVEKELSGKLELLRNARTGILRQWVK